MSALSSIFSEGDGGGCTLASGQSRSPEVVAYQSFNCSAGKPNFGVSIRGRAHTEV